MPKAFMAYLMVDSTVPSRLCSALYWVPFHGSYAVPFLGCKTADVCTDKRTFKKKPPTLGGERSFVQFVLEPLYKIYAQVSFPA